MYAHVTEPILEKPGDRRIKSIYYGVSSDFVDGMFDSCRNVQNPSSGQKALEMLCGREAAKCTPTNWLEFMGDTKSNPMVPFDITFFLSNSNITLPVMNVTLQPMRDNSELCNESCSCQDCIASCKPLPPDVPPHSPTIFGFDPMYFIMTCVYITFLLVFCTSQIWSYFFCRAELNGEASSSTSSINNTEEEASSPTQGHPRVHSVSTSSPCCCDIIGAAFEKRLTRCFSWWGRFCARHPVIVLGCGVVICITLTVGVCFFKVITDPVELWSSPDSQARTEKDYFDNNFG